MRNSSFFRWTLGLSSCGIAASLTPDLMNRLSLPLELQSLTQIEMAGLRIGLLLLGLAIIFLPPWLSQLAHSRPVQRLVEPLPGSIEDYQRQAINWPLIFVALGGAVMFIAIFRHASPWMLTVENGPFDRFTAVVFLCAGLFALWACLRRGISWRVLPLVLLAGFFFAAAAVEISWAQWLPDAEVPASVMPYGIQQNVDNLFGYLPEHGLLIAILSYGVILPLLCARWPFCYRLTWHLGIPVGSMSIALCFLGAGLIHETTVTYVGGSWPAVRVLEIREAMTALACLVFAAEVLDLEHSADQLTAAVQRPSGDLSRDSQPSFETADRA